MVGIADQIATGTNEFGRSTTETSMGVGFAVPIDLIKNDLVRLEHGGHVLHAYLGVATGQGRALGGERWSALSRPGSAAKFGVRSGDLIVAFNDTSITSSGDLTDALTTSRVGDEVKLTILRGSNRVALTANVAAQPTRASSR